MKLISLVREKMTERGWNQTTLAKEIGVTKACVSNWLSETSSPSYKSILKIKKTLGIEGHFAVPKGSDSELLLIVAEELSAILSVDAFTTTKGLMSVLKNTESEIVRM